MPPGAFDYLQVHLDRVRPREVKFTITLGSPPDGTLGCGKFRGIARYKKGKWKLVSDDVFSPNIRRPVNPRCQFTKEEVFHCNEGEPSNRR